MTEIQAGQPGGPKVLVVGNEKGGTGKSTTAMHLAVGLLRAGKTVGVIDTDDPQGTLRRFLTNRRDYGAKVSSPLPMPLLILPEAGPDGTFDLMSAVASQPESIDIVIVDTPGSTTPLTQAALDVADILITPLNDSLVDLDVLAHVNVDLEITGPSHYAEAVWQSKLARAKAGRSAPDWVVMRNRLSSLESHNRREMDRLLGELSNRIGFRQLEGFGERVIYRELFAQGLTIMDIKETGAGGAMNMSHIKARQEVRALILALGL